MIRLAHRRLIIPRGDTGSFTVPAIFNKENSIAVFSIFNAHKRIWTHEFPIENNKILITFSHEDTRNLPIGLYYWDIKTYVNPKYDENNLLIDGDEVHSYYAAYRLPECEITLASKRW